MSDSETLEKIQKLVQSLQQTYVSEKTGHVYVLQTDAINAFKIGKSKYCVQKRVKQLQTGVLSDIKIMFDYVTSNPDLLEKVVHTVLIKYKCKNNREFFECNLEHIKSVITICGIDTLQSINLSTSQSDESNDKFNNSCISDKNKFIYWLDTNLQYSSNTNDYTELKIICYKYFNSRFVNSRIVSPYKTIIEDYIKDKFPNIPYQYSQLKIYKDNQLLRPRGWKYLRFTK